MDTSLVFQALLQEYSTLREEITGINKNQFQISAAVGLGAIGGFGAWLTFFNQEPWVLVLLAALVLAHIFVALDLRLRIMGLSHRIRVVERQIRLLSRSGYVMRWESEYVTTMFNPPGTSPPQRAITLCMRLLRAVFLVPLVIVYIACIFILWSIATVNHPLFWTIGLLVALVSGILIYAFVGFGITATLDMREACTLSGFQAQVNENSAVENTNAQ